MLEWVEQSLVLGVDPLFFTVVFMFLVIVVFKVTSRYGSKLNMPPSPSKLPIIGNLHQLGSLPYRSLQFLSKKHGPVMLLHLGQSPTLIISSADAAREILKTQDLNFSNRPRMNCEDKLLYSNMHMPFVSYNEFYKHVRKICVSQLLSSDKVKSFRSVREEEAHVMIEKIRKSSSSSSTIVVNLSKTISSFTHDVACRVSLGRKFGEEELVGKKFEKMMLKHNEFVSSFNVGDFIPWLSWVNTITGLNRRMVKSFKDFDCFFESVIEEHIEAKKMKSTSGVEDFVDVLLGMEMDSSTGVPYGRDNIKATIWDMFQAGQETTGSTLVWAMTELIRHPEIMKEVQMELREIGKDKGCIREEDLEKCTTLKLVMKENLRLHVVGPLLVPHESVNDTKLLGYDISAKTKVLVNAWAIARDPLLWEDPEEFRPKRFLNASLDYKGNDFKYIPFGAGRRGCPGVLFAIPTMELPLANLLYHFDWTKRSGAPGERDLDVTEGFDVVVYKKYPLHAVATPYHNSQSYSTNI